MVIYTLVLCDLDLTRMGNLMAFRSSIPTHSIYAQIYTQTHKRLTFVLVLACHCALPLAILLSVRHSSICVSMSPCAVSRCDQIGLLSALSDRLLLVHRLATLIHATICAAPASAAAAAAAAAPWPQYRYSITLPRATTLAVAAAASKSVVSIYVSPADTLVMLQRLPPLVIVGAQLCLYAD